MQNIPKIIIQNLNNKEIFIHNKDKTLLDTIHDNGINWMHACGKKGRCTTCKVIILQGEQNITPISEIEQKYLSIKKMDIGERLSCQCNVIDDVIIKTPNECKLSHIEYTD